MERHCLYCNKELDGRLDQKFCGKPCRNNYNNARYREEHKRINDVTRILKKNRQILLELMPFGQVPYTKDQLEQRGFNFSYFTNVYSQNTNNKYYFCFDYGYVKIDGEDQHIPVVWQSYMG